MKRQTPLPELLAPAGSTEALYAAVGAGADAVYLGGRHSARAFAKNFDDQALPEAVRYAHLHGVRVYVALNTLLFDRELPQFLSYAESVAASGADAAIVADVGVMCLLRRHLPALPIHASTQAFIHNTATADFYHSLGAERVVAARELSLAGIRQMVEAARPEIEVFLHGALCVSHSGQCLFSSLVGGRSGNRGECAQPCRLPYEGGKYPLSLSDLALAGHIPELIDSGVSSLKIEGRMKSSSYVAGVTAIYRRLLDERRNATREEWEELGALFSRSGFTDAYFTGHPERKMTGVRTEADKAETRERKENFTHTPVFVTGSARICKNEPSSLSLSCGAKAVTVCGPVPEPARSAPLTAEDIRARLSKTGGTFCTLPPEALDITLDDGLFMTAGALNALRREAIEKLTDTSRPRVEVSYRRPPRPACPDLPKRTAVCMTVPQYRACAASGFFERIYLPPALAAECGAEVAMPPVVTDEELDEIRALLRTAVEGGARYALCESYGQLTLVREHGLIPVGGHRLNVTNADTAETLLSRGVSDILLSPELTAARIADLPHRIISYGRIPLMLTERCAVRDTFGCERCGHAALTDRRGVAFPLLREYRHRMLVLNSLPTYLADRPELLAAAGSPREHYLFTIETEKECASVIAAAQSGSSLGFPVRRLPAK